MPRRAIIDSGPLISFFDRDDHYHKRAIQFLKAQSCELVTTIAVITEVTHLLDFSRIAQLAFLKWIRDGALTIAPITAIELDRIVVLCEKYSDLPMDFADATLIVAAETLMITDVIAIDSHFAVYKPLYTHRLRNIF